MTQNKLFSLAGALGLIGVILGAFGAHALHQALADRQTLAVWQTAVSYHLLHSVALLALAGGWEAVARRSVRLAAAVAWCWTGGVVFFSGSLYGLALGAPRVLGPVTPVGGLLFLAGWGLLVWIGSRHAPAAPPP